jgi:acyl carrier protein
MQEAKRLLADALRIDPTRIGDKATMRDLPQWDSLAHMELIVLVEENLRVTLSMDEILEMTTIPGLARVLAVKRGTTS